MIWSKGKVLAMTGFSPPLLIPFSIPLRDWHLSFYAVKPPSMVRLAPVTKAASGLAR
jgi:hypothetical protein